MSFVGQQAAVQTTSPPYLAQFPSTQGVRTRP